MALKKKSKVAPEEVAIVEPEETLVVAPAEPEKQEEVIAEKFVDVAIPAICPMCKAKFHVLSNFQQHVKTQHEE